jgi:hypothetical protein
VVPTAPNLAANDESAMNFAAHATIIKDLLRRFLRSTKTPNKRVLRTSLPPGLIGQKPHKRTALSGEYYEEVMIIPEGSRYECSTLMDVGPGLCGTSENAQKAKFALKEFFSHAVE